MSDDGKIDYLWFDGCIPGDLQRREEWFRCNREAIVKSERCPFSWNNRGSTTVKGSRLFLHIRNGTGSELCRAELKNKVLSAPWLRDGAPVAFEQRGERLFLRGFSVPLPDPLANTLVREVEGQPEALTAKTSFWIPGGHD